MGASDSRLASFYYGYGRAAGGGSHASSGGSDAADTNGPTAAGPLTPPTSPNRRNRGALRRSISKERGNNNNNSSPCTPKSLQRSRLSTLNSLGRLLGLGKDGYFSRAGVQGGGCTALNPAYPP